MFFGNIAIWGNSLRTEIFIIFFEFLFGYRDMEYLAIPLNFLAIGFAHELYWKMLFLMDGGHIGKVIYTNAKFVLQCLEELKEGLGQAFDLG